MISITQTPSVENAQTHSAENAQKQLVKTELSSTIDTFFNSFKLADILKKVGAYKSKGISAVAVFRILFELVFINKNLFTYLNSGENKNIAKDTFYRFINSCRINWLCFTTLLAAKIVNEKIVPLTDEKRINVFTVDDTVYKRDRSKNVELLSKVYDHSKKCFVRGFRLLTLGWSDGNTFMPVNFCLLSSADEKSRIEEAQNVDKRTNGYKQRQLAQGTAPVAMMELLSSAIKAGFHASYVLFDSWFSLPATILAIKKKALDVIAMVKKTSKVHYCYGGKMLSAKEIYKRNRKRSGRSKYLLSVIVNICSADRLESIPAQLIFVRNRNKKKDYLILISTDVLLSEEEVIRIYGKRWDIEVFFKVCKSYLRLAKECQSIGYDAMTAYVAIVFARYMMLSLSNRMQNDARTVGTLFYHCCDELADITWMEAIQLLLKAFVEFVSDKFLLSKEEVEEMLDAFMAVIPAALKEKLIRCV